MPEIIRPLPQAVADSKMTETFALADVEGKLVATLEQLDARPSDGVPFRVLLIWSGRRLDNQARSPAR